MGTTENPCLFLKGVVAGEVLTWRAEFRRQRDHPQCQTQSWHKNTFTNSTFSNLRVYLTESVHKVDLQKSIPAQIRQLVIYDSNNKG